MDMHSHAHGHEHRLLGTLDLLLRDVVQKGKQSVSQTLKSKKGEMMQVGWLDNTCSYFPLAIVCLKSCDSHVILFVFVLLTLLYREKMDEKEVDEVCHRDIARGCYFWRVRLVLVV